jgi:hypothetical protein
MMTPYQFVETMTELQGIYPNSVAETTFASYYYSEARKSIVLNESEFSELKAVCFKFYTANKWINVKEGYDTINSKSLENISAEEVKEYMILSTKIHDMIVDVMKKHEKEIKAELKSIATTKLEIQIMDLSNLKVQVEYEITYRGESNSTMYEENLKKIEHMLAKLQVELEKLNKQE